MTLSDASAVIDAAVPIDPLLTHDDRAQLLRYMAMMRSAEERALSLYKQGNVPGSFYDGRGQEAISVGASFALAPRDRLCILHRDLGAHFVRGVTPDRYLANYMGRTGGVTGGKDGNMHFGDRELGCVGMVSMLPDMMLVATGMAMAFKLRGEPRCALTWFGDGSTSRGDFHEAMNWAGVQKLPVIFVLENNQYAYSTPLEQQFAVDPVERAQAYGFPGVRVDGNDVLAVHSAVKHAADAARRGDGPTFVELVTYRVNAHSSSDDPSRYRDESITELWKSQRDPIRRFETYLTTRGWLTAGERESIAQTLETEVRESIARQEAAAKPALETLIEDVYEEPTWLLREQLAELAAAPRVKAPHQH